MQPNRNRSDDDRRPPMTLIQHLILIGLACSLSMILTLTAIQGIPSIRRSVCPATYSSYRSVAGETTSNADTRRILDSILTNTEKLDRIEKLILHEKTEDIADHSKYDKATNELETDTDSSHPTTRTINFVYGLWDDDKPMRSEFKANLKTWGKLNPAWEIRVWGAKDIKSFWKKEFPEFTDLWKLCRPIQRADISRLMIVLRLGGLYADLDTAPTKAIDDVFQVGGFRHAQHDTVLCIEDIKSEKEMENSRYWPIRKGLPEYKTRIANYVFWAKPGSAVIKYALDIAAKRVRETAKEFYHVQGRPDLRNPYAIIYTTGPDTITEATFSTDDGGHTDLPPPTVLVLAEDECHMNNMATGTWIGDKSKATKLQ